MYLKEMFIIKRIGEQRELFCTRIKTGEGDKIVTIQKQEIKNETLTTKLLSYSGANPGQSDK
jgi:hypothetical protein